MQLIQLSSVPVNPHVALNLPAVETADPATLIELLNSPTPQVVCPSGPALATTFSLLGIRAHNGIVEVINPTTYQYLIDLDRTVRPYNARNYAVKGNTLTALNNPFQALLAMVKPPVKRVTLQTHTVTDYPGLDGYTVYLGPKGSTFTSQAAFIKYFLGEGETKKEQTKRRLAVMYLTKKLQPDVENHSSNSPQTLTVKGKPDVESNTQNSPQTLAIKGKAEGHFNPSDSPQTLTVKGKPEGHCNTQNNPQTLAVKGKAEGESNTQNIQYQINDGKQTRVIEAIDEDTFIHLLLHFAKPKHAYSPEYAAKCQSLIGAMLKAGARKFHHELIHYYEPRQYPRGASEVNVQQELINLIALSGRNFKFEVPAKAGNTYRRFDFVDLQCTAYHRLYELKPDTVTTEHVIDKLITCQYLAVASKRYPTNKVIELVFTSPNGINPDTLAYIAGLADSEGYIQQTLTDQFGLTNTRRYRVKYQPLAEITQPLVDSVYNTYLEQGDRLAIKHLNDNPASFLNSACLPRPTAKLLPAK